MVGDLNADQLSSNWNGSKLKRIFQAFNFQIVIHNPKELLQPQVPFGIWS